MSHYSGYKEEVTSLSDIAEVLKTIERISGAYIQIMEKQLKAVLEYKNSIIEMLSTIELLTDTIKHPLTESKHGNDKTLVIFSTNKGLIGKLSSKLENILANKKNNYSKFISIGEVSKRFINGNNINVYKHFEIKSDIPTDEEIALWTSYLINLFIAGNSTQIDLLLPKYISMSVQETELSQFLPFNISKLNTDIASANRSGFMPIFEPSPKQIVAQLIKEYTENFFYEKISQAKLAEFSARAITTENAANKSKERVAKIQHEYFKTRRKDLTSKQLQSFGVHNLKTNILINYGGK